MMKMKCMKVKHLECCNSMSAYKKRNFDNKIKIAKDGGAVPELGLLGFLLTDSKGNPFITCYGQQAEYEPKSYRCEICAALAAVRLL